MAWFRPLRDGVRRRSLTRFFERALEAEAECADILDQVASVRGAISGLTAELIEDHLREHVLEATDVAARTKGAAELMNVVRTYLK